MSKLAISIITYNRAKHIDEHLKFIVNETQKRNIKIYIFDGSTDSNTENIVKRYIRQGYKNIYYNKYENNIKSHIKRLKDAFYVPDADYVWLCGDKFIISPINYDLVLDCIERRYDIITLYSCALNGIQYFTDYVKYFEYTIVPLTHIGSSILKRELLQNINFEHCLKYPAFWVLVLYSQAIQKKDFKGITIQVNENSFRINSKYNTKSESENRMWDTWIVDWYKTIIDLPRSYDYIKKNILNALDVKMNFFCISELLLQRGNGEFNIKKYISVYSYINKVICTPKVLIFLIALIPKKMALLFGNVLNNIK